MPVYKCSLEISDVLREYYGSPMYKDLTNPYFDPDLPYPLGNFCIEMHYKGEWRDFSKFLVGKKTRIVKRFGSLRGQAQFQLADDGPLPAMPLVLTENTEGLATRIWNRNKTKLYFRGWLVDCDPYDMAVRDDLSLKTVWNLTIGDLSTELDRRRIRQVYRDVSLGYIAVDALTKAAPFFDVSAIPTTGTEAGMVVKRLPFMNASPAQVLETILRLEPTWTYWIDETLDKPKIYLGDREYIASVCSITDQNVWKLIEWRSLKLKTDKSLLRNHIIMEYTEAYDVGTVDVLEGGQIIYGNGTKFYGNVDANTTIQVDGLDATYTINQNRSTLDESIEELDITSGYLGPDGVNLPYVIRGATRYVEEVDDTSIQQERLIRGDDGIITWVVEQRDLLLTKDEAQLFARSLLKFSRPLLNGGFRAKNYNFHQFEIDPGKTIDLDLQQTKGTRGKAVISEVAYSDANHGGYFTTADGKEEPELDIEVRITDREFLELERLRSLWASTHRFSVNEASDNIRKSKRVNDFLFMKGCAHLVLPLLGRDTLSIQDTQPRIHRFRQGQDTFSMSDEPAEITEIDTTGTFKTFPGTGGRSARCIGATGYGRTIAV